MAAKRTIMQFWASESMIDEMKRISEIRGISRAQILRDFCMEYIESFERENVLSVSEAYELFKNPDSKLSSEIKASQFND